MNFETWEPVYEAILADMGYDRAGDEAARDELATLVGDAATLAPADVAFDGDRVAIAAPGHDLSGDLSAVDSADVVVAAGVAADRLLDDGRRVDWVVTDLDGHADRVPRFTRDGIPVAIHAHGDNRDLRPPVQFGTSAGSPTATALRFWLTPVVPTNWSSRAGT